MEPVISLILPAYNVADYIDACLDSCLNQDIPSESYEIIVVNDGSTDDTPPHLKAYSSKYANIRVLNQPNQGVSAARNNGAKIAKGKYIWFIDSDDMISANCLGSIVRVMDELNLEMFLVAPCIPFAKDFPTTFDVQKDMSPVHSGAEHISPAHPTSCCIWCFVVSRSYWVKNHFEFYKGITWEDAQLMPFVVTKCSRLSALTTFSCYSYTQRSGSIMHSAPNKRKLLGNIVTTNTHLAYTKEVQDPRVKEFFLNTSRDAFIGGLNTLIGMKADKSLRKEFFDSIVERPTHISHDSFIKRMFQRVVLKFPRLYVSIRIALARIR